MSGTKSVIFDTSCVGIQLFVPPAPRFHKELLTEVRASWQASHYWDWRDRALKKVVELNAFPKYKRSRCGGDGKPLKILFGFVPLNGVAASGPQLGWGSTNFPELWKILCEHADKTHTGPFDPYTTIQALLDGDCRLHLDRFNMPNTSVSVSGAGDYEGGGLERQKDSLLGCIRGKDCLFFGREEADTLDVGTCDCVEFVPDRHRHVNIQASKIWHGSKKAIRGRRISVQRFQHQCWLKVDSKANEEHKAWIKQCERHGMKLPAPAEVPEPFDEADEDEAGQLSVTCNATDPDDEVDGSIVWEGDPVLRKILKLMFADQRRDAKKAVDAYEQNKIRKQLIQRECATGKTVILVGSSWVRDLFPLYGVRMWHDNVDDNSYVQIRYQVTAFKIGHF